MHQALRNGTALWPGALLATGVAALALLTERVQLRWLGRPWIDALVFAIVLGTVLRTAVRLPARVHTGIAFAAKLPLEVAIVLLGASVSFSAVGAAGALLLGLIAAIVLLAIGIGYGIGRLLGLPARLATLVACGNAICGNSAIVAAAPVIDADSDEVAASIAFTAALGIVVVLALPLAVPLFGLDQRHYGILAGMTVYAVPQVLAATLPVGAVSAQVGALVKLMRVVMLGPVMLLLGLTAGRPGAARVPLHRLLPWFVLGFIGMMLLRSSGLLAPALADAMQRTSALLTLVAMAALGLSVNLRSVLASGGRVLAAGTLSLLALAGISALLVWWLP
ncbi:putative sulfate exporter family transporter [Xanthomonas sp. 1678]|uniref:YeiH family protein n=1 Tax=Xanthomonas sp. 1678 TaxID=3158788 RepID=UPI0028629C76|nr:putative integral membrane protein (TIGR00698 family) [Xanthomonas translucens]